MSTVRHRPEGLEQLEAQTRFSRKELQILYRGFKNECPSGVVNEDTFKDIYAQFFPQGDASTYAHFLFNAFDTDHNGSVSFEDFVMGLSILLRGSIQEKLNWAFNLYDINKDGYITKEKMDKNKDGVVTIDEFIDCCQNVSWTMRTSCDRCTSLKTFFNSWLAGVVEALEENVTLTRTLTVYSVLCRPLMKDMILFIHIAVRRRQYGADTLERAAF
ncbi:hypothetical protein F7725_004462 [Dissostichus mawsoni]|uniref:Kv channel-interacting protein 4 n=1 Tax=Dissostichus mawsoni TaxID=36200 RepID=A0A7J5XLE9_DISMA|nr:hypothetical protein F7725_004462 [Dissostichus mawsoni]